MVRQSYICNHNNRALESSEVTMAESLGKLLPPCFIFFLFFLLDLTTSKTHKFSRNISPTELGLQREKLSHLHFYFHDIVSGPNPTAVRVAEAPTTNSSKTLFGAVFMMEDPLTEGSELSSTMVGGAQGIYASASQSEVGLLMVLTFAFTCGKYNGSNLSILGRNTIMSNVREMPIVGGSGLFRFARGYAQAHTHSLNLTTGDAVVEYNVHVLHY